MDPVHERELVERCRRGDEGAFQELIDRYKDLVFALVGRTVQDRSRASRSAGKGDRSAAAQLSLAGRGALSAGRAVRGSGGSAAAAARDAEDSALSGKATAATVARDGSSITSFSSYVL